MFIDTPRDATALRQEGHVKEECRSFTTPVDLLTEVNIAATPIYKHGPPDGGQHRRDADL